MPWRPFAAEGQSLGAGLGLGLAVVMWNYSGWDTPSTCLGEAKAPEHAFRRALFVALPVIAAAYVLPVGAVLATGATDWSEWNTGALPRLAARGRRGLARSRRRGRRRRERGRACSSTLLLTNSRLPYVLARDGLLPAGARPRSIRASARRGWRSCSRRCSTRPSRSFSFKELIVLNVWLYSHQPAGRARGLRDAARAEPEDGAAVAGAAAAFATALWWPGCRRPVAAGDGHGGLANTLAGVVAALTGSGRLRGAAAGSSRLSSMTWARAVERRQRVDVGLPAHRHLVGSLARRRIEYIATLTLGPVPLQPPAHPSRTLMRSPSPARVIRAWRASKIARASSRRGRSSRSTGNRTDSGLSQADSHHARRRGMVSRSAGWTARRAAARAASVRGGCQRQRT